VKPVFKATDLSELVSDTIQVLEPSALLKRIELLFKNPGKMLIEADAAMIMTTFRNIVSNAIKFTRPGGWVMITISQDKDRVRVDFSDSGVGIAPAEMAKLFHVEENYKSKGTAGETGSGLGLILCKEYVELHGGEISVVSEKDKGSVFTIILPVNQPR
jgi:signal transduction histidine kinase